MFEYVLTYIPPPPPPPRLARRVRYMGSKLRPSKGYDIPQAIKEAFAVVDKAVCENRYMDYEGSTASAVILGKNGDDIWSANVGDSRAVLCRTTGDDNAPSAVLLTEDHKPDAPVERARVEGLGGTVKWYGFKDDEGDPVPGLGAYRVNGNLAVSRSFGDKLERPYVTAEPDVKRTPRDLVRDKFIVIASDGLWDVMTNQEAVEHVVETVASMERRKLRELMPAPGAVVAAAAAAGGRSDAISSSSLSPSSPSSSSPSSSMMNAMDAMKNAKEMSRKESAKKLCDEALRRGTSDNVSVIVLWLV